MHHEERSLEQRNESFWNLDQNVGDGERVVSGIAGGALVAYGIKQGGLGGTLLALLGGNMLFRGVSGHCNLYQVTGINTAAEPGNPDSPYGKGWLSGKVHVTQAVTINRSAAELYQFWRNFENLPIFMKHLESVKVLDGGRSHWVAKAPLGQKAEWDAELTSEVENEKIGWRSVEGSDIANSGVVEFLPTRNRGTEVKVTMIYEAPGGKLGSYLAWAFGEEPSSQVAEDLRRFKSLMETGLILNVEGQPSGRVELPKARAARA